MRFWFFLDRSITTTGFRLETRRGNCSGFDKGVDKGFEAGPETGFEAGEKLSKVD